MARTHTIQTNFTSGEVSPLMLSREDVNKFFNGAQQIENFIVRPQGGALRRSGTRFVNEVKDSSKIVRLHGFEFSTIQAYMLEFGDKYIRIYKDGGLVEDVGVPVEVITPYTEDQLVDLDFAQSADRLYIVHPLHQQRQLDRTSDIDWNLTLFETIDGPYDLLNTDEKNVMRVDTNSIIDRATLIADIATFTVGDVGEFVEYQLSGFATIGIIREFISDTEVLIEPLENVIAEVDPKIKLTTPGGTISSTHTLFTNAVVGSYIKVPDESFPNWYLIDDFDDETTVDVTAENNFISQGSEVLIRTDRIITADVITTEDTFVSTDVGRLFRMNLTGEQLPGKITEFIDAKNVKVELDRTVPTKDDSFVEFRDDARTDQFRLGAWSVTTGFPTAITFHEERLVFGGSTSEPQGVWMSKSGDYENFAPTEPDSIVTDDSAITYIIATGQINAIQWLSSGPVLLIGTIGGEWQARSGTSINEPITPTSIHLTEQTEYGSNKVPPIRINGAVLFAQRSGRKVRELIYSFEIDSFVARDMTVVSEHILRDGIGTKDASFQREPNNIYWTALIDGTLAGLTYEKEQEVFAWHRHIVGGSFNGGQAVVEALATIPSVEGFEDDLYMIVKRTIDGTTKRYIELLDPMFDPDGTIDADDMFFVDSGLSYSGTPISVVGGLGHLEGEEVQVVNDGAAEPEKTVFEGQVTLENTGSNIHVGLKYRALLHTMPLTGGGNFGTAQGKQKRIHEIGIRLKDTIELKHGPTINDLTTL